MAGRRQTQCCPLEGSAWNCKGSKFRSTHQPFFAAAGGILLAGVAWIGSRAPSPSGLCLRQVHRPRGPKPPTTELHIMSCAFPKGFCEESNPAPAMSGRPCTARSAVSQNKLKLELCRQFWPPFSWLQNERLRVCVCVCV